MVMRRAELNQFVGSAHYLSKHADNDESRYVEIDLLRAIEPREEEADGKLIKSSCFFTVAIDQLLRDPFRC
jgi:hypothetical protein